MFEFWLEILYNNTPQQEQFLVNVSGFSTVPIVRHRYWEIFMVHLSNKLADLMKQINSMIKNNHKTLFSLRCIAI